MIRLTLQRLASLALGVLALASTAAEAQFTISAPTTDWVVVPYPSTTTTDFHLDQQTGSAEADIVGGGVLPSFYTKLVPGNSNTNGTLYFRARLGGDDSPAGFKSACFLGVDANGDGKLDLFFGVNNSGNPDGIYIWKAGTGQNISPSTTSIDSQNPLKTYTLSSSNYHWAPVTATIDPEANSAALRNLDGRTGGDPTDHFISFSLPFADLVAAFQTAGIAVNTSTTMNYVMGTATQANAFNQDLNGVNGGTSSTATWASLGAMSLPLNSTGAKVLTPPVITSTSTVGTTAGATFSHQLTATYAPTVFGATGLPAGVTLNSATGLLSGTAIVPGTYIVMVTATNADGTGSATLTIAVAKASQTILFPQPSAITYGTAPITLTATASSELPVAYSIVSGPGTVSGGVVTVRGAGTILVRADQAGNGFYQPATGVEQSITVNKAPLTVTAANATKTFGAANPALNATYGGFVNGENFATSGIAGAPTLATAATASSPAGAYPITAAAGTLTAQNYAFTFVPGVLTVIPATQTITFPQPEPMVYGSTAQTLTATSTSGLPVSYSVVSGQATINWSAVTITGAGEVVIQAAQAGTTNHEAAEPITRTLTVQKAPLTVTALNASRSFGEANPVFTATYSGFVNGETLASSGVTGSPVLVSAADKTSPAGTYSITAAPGTLAAANYEFNFASGTLTVGAASQSIEFATIADVVYGAPAVPLSATATSGLPVTYTVNGPATLADGALVITGAGEVVVTASQAGNANYSAAAAVEQRFTVAKAPLLVTAADQSRAYGAADPKFTHTFSGFVNGETLQTSGVAGSPALTTVATEQSSAGVYPIAASVGTLGAANYRFEFAPGTLTINPVGQSISFDAIAAAKYGDDAISLSASATSGLPIQFTVVSGPGSIQDGKLTILGAGEIVVQARQIGNANYDAAPAVERSVVAGKALINVTAENKSRTFGEANPAFSATYSGFVNGETFPTSGVTGSPVLTSSADKNSPAGSYPITAALGSLAAANYDFIFAPGVLTVGAASQTIEFSMIADAVYGTPAITLSATATSELPVAYTVAGPAKIVDGMLVITGAGEVVVTAHQAGNASYSAAPDVERNFTVAKAALTVTAADKSRNFGAANPQLTHTFSGFVNGETLETSGVSGSPSLTTNATAQSSVGTYPISVTAGTLGAANYRFEFAAGTLTINAIGQEITFDAIPAAKYGDAPITLSATTTSGLPVQFSLVSGLGEIDGDKLTILGAGEIVIRAEQAGDGNHEPALAVNQTLTVSKASLTVSAADRARAVGEENPKFSVDYTGFVKGESLATSGVAGIPSISTTATTSSVPSTYPIVPTLGSLTAANYDFTFEEGRLVIGAGVQVIDFPAPAAVTYGTGSIILQATASSGLPVTFTVESGPGVILGNALTVSGAGEITVRASQPGNESYSAAPEVTRVLKVGKATLTVKAVDSQQVTGGKLPVFTANYSGLVNGETFAISGISGDPELTTQASASSPAGEYPIQVALGTLASSNYEFNLVPGTLTISYVNQAPSFTISGRPVVNEDSGAQSLSGVITAINPGAANENEQVLAFQVSNSNAALFEVQPAIAADGTLTFTPAPNAHGVTTVTVILKDDGGTANGGSDTSASQTFEIEITSVNDAPVAVTDLAATTGENPVTMNVLANDSDADEEPVLFVSATLASGTGLVETTKDGEVTFTPAPGFRGLAVIVYTIKDAAGLEAVGQLQVTVNAAPLALPDVAATEKDQAVTIDVLANDSDADEDPLSIAKIMIDPAFGTATVSQNGSRILFTPAASLIGTVQFSYSIIDGRGGRAEATVAVQVGSPSPNLPPIARSDSATTKAGVAVTIPVLANDTDPEGGVLTIGSAGVEPSQGSVTIEGGNLRFIPATGFTGTATLYYVALDQAENSAQGTVTVEVTAPPAPPIAVSDTGRVESGTAKDFAVLLNDLSFDGTSMMLKGATLAGGANGTVSLNTDGTIRYRSTAGFQGTVEILYTVEDSNGQQAQGILNIEVFLVLQNGTPIAVNDTAHTRPGQPVTVDPLANDSDPDGDKLTIKAISILEGSGTVTVDDAGSVVFTPAAGFTGIVTIRYQAADPSGAESTAQIEIIVNTPPVPGADALRAGTGKTIKINVLGNDTDEDGHPLHVAAFTGDAAAGTFTIATNGDLVFTSNAGFSGPTLLTYTLEDSLGAIVEGHVTITVNDAPVAVADNAKTRIDTTISVNVLGNDSDPNGDAIHVAAATVDAAQGSVTIESDGTLLFVPASTFGSSAVIHYLIADTFGETASADLTINRENTSPTVADRTVYGFCDVPLSINALRGAADLEGDNLRVVSISQPSLGKAAIGANGYVTYTPSKAFNNPKLTDSFVVTIEDGTGEVSSMTVQVAAFNSLKGTYQALISAAHPAQNTKGEGEAPIAGNIVLKLANGATFTGALQLGTERHPFSGRLTGALQYEKPLKIVGYPNARLRIRFQPEAKAFSAEISGLESTLVASNGLRRASRTQSFAGSYQSAARAEVASSTARAAGWSVRVNEKGRAAYRGVLSDGRIAIGGAHLFETGEMPIYRVFQGTKKDGRGYVAGTLQLPGVVEQGWLTGSVQEHFQEPRLIVLDAAK